MLNSLGLDGVSRFGAARDYMSWRPQASLLSVRDLEFAGLHAVERERVRLDWGIGSSDRQADAGLGFALCADVDGRAGLGAGLTFSLGYDQLVNRPTRGDFPATGAREVVLEADRDAVPSGQLAYALRALGRVRELSRADDAIDPSRISRDACVDPRVFRFGTTVSFADDPDQTPQPAHAGYERSARIPLASVNSTIWKARANLVLRIEVLLGVASAPGSIRATECLYVANAVVARDAVGITGNCLPEAEYLRSSPILGCPPLCVDLQVFGKVAQSVYQS